MVKMKKMPVVGSAAS
jgi:hypothetical protein